MARLVERAVASNVAASHRLQPAVETRRGPVALTEPQQLAIQGHGVRHSCTAIWRGRIEHLGIRHGDYGAVPFGHLGPAHSHDGKPHDPEWIAVPAWPRHAYR